MIIKNKRIQCILFYITTANKLLEPLLTNLVKVWFNLNLTLSGINDNLAWIPSLTIVSKILPETLRVTLVWNLVPSFQSGNRNPEREHLDQGVQGQSQHYYCKEQLFFEHQTSICLFFLVKQKQSF